MVSLWTEKAHRKRNMLAKAGHTIEKAASCRYPCLEPAVSRMSASRRPVKLKAQESKTRIWLVSYIETTLEKATRSQYVYDGPRGELGKAQRKLWEKKHGSWFIFSFCGTVQFERGSAW
jgi:hypothetical protein